jgi:hypothetical protein
MITPPPRICASPQRHRRPPASSVAPLRACSNIIRTTST